LTWLVLTKSLAYALAETSPEVALWLNPNLPRALLTLANREREKLIASHAQTHATASLKGPAEEAAPSFAPPSEDDSEERKALRAEIRALAKRAVANSPLSARAYRVLAEVTEEPEQVRLLMQEAVKRSRRESAAVFWLLNDSFERKDLADVVDKADVLLRTRPKLAPYVMNYLGQVAASPEGRQLLVPLLAGMPSWRAAFFKALPKSVRDEDTPLDLMIALQDAGSLPSTQELAPYIGVLMSKERVELAYNAWLQLVPKEKLASLSLLNNAGFAEDPSGLPFDWSIKRGQNTMVDFVSLRDSDGGRALRFSFGVGRASFPETSQILLLTPGLYRLEGTFQGLLTAKRGLRWELHCVATKSKLAETEMLFGNPQAAQSFTLEIEIPDREDCRAQKLLLYHHARSPSEELISGEIFFRGIQLVRLK
ncbi:MAG: hypothetical protein H7X74_01095, partial [Methyloceanibacter sp.]|nr:hypothetical protein [Methyloceanibacter sp.]